MIVDVNLGAGTTGYDVARFARRITAALPVIFVSGQSSPDSFAANSVPGSLFLSKPFTAAELMERVRMLIGDNDDQA
jgi:DNA-binding response OmpR family regulator